MSRSDDERDKIVADLIVALEEHFGVDITAIYVGFLIEDGRGRSLTAIIPNVEYVPNPGTPKLPIEVAFLLGIRDAIDDALAKLQAN
jgi:hypothetical protein